MQLIERSYISTDSPARLATRKEDSMLYNAEMDSVACWPVGRGWLCWDYTATKLGTRQQDSRICKMSRHELSQLVLCEFSERLVDFALRPPEDVDECTSFIVAITELITVRDSAFLFRQHHTFQRVPMGFL